MPKEYQYFMMLDTHWSKEFKRWFSALIGVLVIFGGMTLFAAAFYKAPPAPGIESAPAAIMLEFAMIAEAPPTEQEAETIQSATQVAPQDVPQPFEEQPVEPEPVDVPQEPTPAPEDVPAPIVEDNQAEMVLPSEQQEQEAEVAQLPETPPLPQQKPEQPRPQRPVQQQAQEPNDAPIAETQRSSAAPTTAAQPGRNFRAPNQGNSVASSGDGSRWQAMVQNKVNRNVRRFQRQIGGARGIAVVEFNYNTNGVISGARVTRSTGNPHIDRIAPRIVMSASPIPPHPQGKGGTTSVAVRMN